MKPFLNLAMLTVAALALAACDTGGPSSGMASGSPASQSACEARVNLNNGTSSGAVVTSADMTTDGTVVYLSDQNGTDWRCLASNDGTVLDLAVST